MSCSVHDGIELEDRGVPCVPVHTEVFMNSAAAHALAFGRPDYRSVAIRHPIAGLDPDSVRARAADVVDRVAAVLTGSEGSA